MPRTLDQWIDAELVKINKVHSNIDRAGAAELVRNVRELQAARPREYKWRRRSQKARGYKSLHQSIKIDAEKLETWTDHIQGKEFHERGGIVRPKRKRWMAVAIKSWTPGQSGFIAIRASSGNMVIVHAKRRSNGISGLLLKQATLPANRWVLRAKAATMAGSDERIADKVYDTRG